MSFRGGIVDVMDIYDGRISGRQFELSLEMINLQGVSLTDLKCRLSELTISCSN